MESGPSFGARGSPALRWSVYAGLYAFACAAATALVLSPVLSLLAEVIGVPTAAPAVLFASPALVVGAAVWWALVERRGTYTYPLGAASGLVTVLAVGGLWTARFVAVWGVEMLATDAGSVLAGFVLGVAAAAGLFGGLPLMFLRRRRNRGSAPETDGWT